MAVCIIHDCTWTGYVIVMLFLLLQMSATFASSRKDPTDSSSSDVKPINICKKPHFCPQQRAAGSSTAGSCRPRTHTRVLCPSHTCGALPRPPAALFYPPSGGFDISLVCLILFPNITKDNNTENPKGCWADCSVSGLEVCV